MTETVGIWIAGFLTLAIFSFLYKDNVFYKIAESIYVGVSAGYLLVQGWHDVVVPNLIMPLRGGNLLYVFPAALSLFIILQLFDKTRWFSHISIAFVVGIGAGYGFVTFLKSNLYEQVYSAIVPLWNGNLFSSAGEILLLVGTATGLFYFFFSIEHKWLFRAGARTGMIFLMITFGASFGYTVMARISLLIGRFYFLMHDWLRILK
ncbi:hypothetical protein JXL83_06620 [candidate division WOR-3 bacterium]|nr:hypothetical protein [candidate division WOR-3 bacterium]